MTDTAPAALDVDALHRLLDGEHAEIRTLVRATLSEPRFDRRVVADLPRDAYRDQVLEWARMLAAEGLTTLGFPRAYRGESNVGASVAAFETLAHGDLSLLVKVGVQFGLWGGAVLQLGTEAHHERLLGPTATLALPGCFAMTERGHGSDVQSLRTTATYDAQAREWVVDSPDPLATKDWIGNAARHGRIAAVFAQLHTGGEAHGVHAFVVPIRDEAGAPLPGVTIEDCGAKLGLEGVDNGRLTFDRVRVGRDALLDRFASVAPDGTYASAIDSPDRRFFTMLGTLVQGRVSVGGAAIAATKSALTIAVRYALTRRQFSAGDGSELLLLDYPSHQRRLLPALARTYALHAAQERLVANLHRVLTATDAIAESERRELETEAAGLKAIATWHATDTIQACREACGGQGYLRINGLAALKADTDVFTTFEGDNTVLLQLVGKALLTGFRDHFEDLDPLGMVRFVGGQVLDTVVERTAARQLLGALADVVPGVDDDGDVLDRAYQLRLVREREVHMVRSLAGRLKRGLDGGGEPLAVFRAVQDHLLATARAHVDRTVTECFAELVARCADPALAAALDRLCDLHALSAVEREGKWYLEHGRLSATRAKAVTRSVDELCARVRHDAAVLVDAWAIPDALLQSPLAALGPDDA